MTIRRGAFRKFPPLAPRIDPIAALAAEVWTVDARDCGYFK